MIRIFWLFILSFMSGYVNASGTLQIDYIYSCQKQDLLYQVIKNNGAKAQQFPIAESTFSDAITFLVDRNGSVKKSEINLPLYLKEIEKKTLNPGQSYLQKINLRRYFPEKLDRSIKAILILFYAKGALLQQKDPAFELGYYYKIDTQSKEDRCPIVLRRTVRP